VVVDEKNIVYVDGIVDFIVRNDRIRVHPLYMEDINAFYNSHDKRMPFN
jgi:hypothetical protein